MQNISENKIHETRLNVRLKGQMAEFVDEQIASHRFESQSEFIRALIRKEMDERLTQKEKLREMIVTGYSQFGRGEFQARPIEEIWNNVMEEEGRPDLKRPISNE